MSASVGTRVRTGMRATVRARMTMSMRAVAARSMLPMAAGAAHHHRDEPDATEGETRQVHIHL